MSDLKTPFRYDYVGSFLRPEKLKKARADYETGMSALYSLSIKLKSLDIM